MIINEKTIELLDAFAINNGNVRNLTLVVIERNIRDSFSSTTQYNIYDECDIRDFWMNLQDIFSMAQNEIIKLIGKQERNHKVFHDMRGDITNISFDEWLFNLETDRYFITIYIN